MRVQADVLKMAKTAEQKEHIKWFYARYVFFGGSRAAGLALAREADHEDARFFVSLFLSGAPATRQEAEAVFLAHADDARCLCWAGQCGTDRSVTERSARAGCAWGQYHWARLCGLDERMLWIEMSVAQGEPDGLWWKAFLLWSGIGLDMDKQMDKIMAEQMWRSLAEMGHASSQTEIAERCCDKDSLERFVWLRRAAMQCNFPSAFALTECVAGNLNRYKRGAVGPLILSHNQYLAAARIVFEIGYALDSFKEWRKACYGAEREHCGDQCIQLYRHWCKEAKKSVLCWLWIAKKTLVVSKDIRLLIADLIWEERAAWSAKKPAEGTVFEQVGDANE